MIDKYLNFLQENKAITRNSNAPCAAYEAVYEKKCPHERGRYSKPHKTKTWRGIEVDAHLEDKWLNDLSKIKEIEMRSSCEGHEKDWVTFVIFRFIKSSKYKTKEIENKLEATDKITKVSGHMGSGGQIRFVVAAKTWYGEPTWEAWWSTIASRIRKAIK